jgi:hypothetical protein
MAKGKAEFKIGKGTLINHTSITDSEFGYLLPFFENVFDSYFKYHTLAGTARIRLACKQMIVFLVKQKMSYFSSCFI